jgi:hypothetical protein
VNETCLPIAGSAVPRAQAARSRLCPTEKPRVQRNPTPDGLGLVRITLKKAYADRTVTVAMGLVGRRETPRLMGT